MAVEIAKYQKHSASSACSAFVPSAVSTERCAILSHLLVNSGFTLRHDAVTQLAGRSLEGRQRAAEKHDAIERDGVRRRLDVAPDRDRGAERTE